MRIFGFIISAAVLHVVVLGFSPESRHHQVDELLVGVELVQRRMDSLATADSSSEGQEPAAADVIAAPLTDPADKVEEADAAHLQEPAKELIERQLPVEVSHHSPESEEQLPAVTEEPPRPSVPQPQPPPAQIESAAAATDKIAVLPPEQDVSSAADQSEYEEAEPAGQGSPIKHEASISASPRRVDGVPDTHQSLAVQVAAQPRYGYHPAPAYPRLARNRGWEGTVEFKIRVLANGEVGEVKMKNSSGYKSLDQAARRAIKRWRFTPASRAGKVVESWVVVPVHFVLDGQTRSR